MQKQQNRVQLSFPSIIKIFAVYGVAIDLVFLGLYLIIGLYGADNLLSEQLIIAMLLTPFLMILLATLSYPFFAMINHLRGGGLRLTIVRRNTSLRD